MVPPDHKDRPDLRVRKALRECRAYAAMSELPDLRAQQVLQAQPAQQDQLG